jgi:hypothetical protein
LQVVRQIGTAPQGIASFAMDERGEIYVVGYEGMVYEIDLSNANFEEEQKVSELRGRAAAGGQ